MQVSSKSPTHTPPYRKTAIEQKAAKNSNPSQWSGFRSPERQPDRFCGSVAGQPVGGGNQLPPVQQRVKHPASVAAPQPEDGAAGHGGTSGQRLARKSDESPAQRRASCARNSANPACIGGRRSVEGSLFSTSSRAKWIRSAATH